LSTSTLQQDFVIRIDKEGSWFYNGAQIIHPAVLRVFNDGLFKGEDGDYYLRVEDDLAAIEVEDAPFVVTRVTPIEEGGALVGFMAGLSDETEEVLNINSIEINEKNVPYCVVKRGLSARFTSQAYYMLAHYIDYDEKADAYHIRAAGSTHPIVYRGGSR